MKYLNLKEKDESRLDKLRSEVNDGSVLRWDWTPGLLGWLVQSKVLTCVASLVL